MDWAQALPLVAIATVLLYLPGAGLALAMGVRGTLVPIAAPALTMGMISGAAIVLERLHIRWGVISFGVTAAALISLGLLIWLLIRAVSGTRLEARATIAPFPLFAGLAIAGSIMTVTLVKIFPKPFLFAQTFDNIFHSNVVQYIIDTGSASSFTVADLASRGGTGFYPAAWHGFVSLILEPARMADSSVPVAVAENAATLAVIVGAWALGVLALTQVVAGTSVWASVLAGAFAATVPMFPWLYLEWGSLYPNLLGNSLIPALLAMLLLVRVPGGPKREPARAAVAPVLPEPQGVDDAAPTASASLQPLVATVPQRLAEPTRARRVAVLDQAELVGTTARLTVGLVLLASVPGTMLSHPNTTFGLGLAVVVIGWSMLFGSMRKVDRPAAVWLTASAVALLGLTIALGYGWVALAPPSPVKPPTPIELAQAIWSLLVGAPAQTSPTWALPVLFLAGIAAAVWQRKFGQLALALVAMTIYLVAVSATAPKIAEAFGGLFYQDPRRIGVLTFILCLPIILRPFGVVAVGIDRLTGRVRPELVRQLVSTALVGVLAAAMVVPTVTLSFLPHLRSSRALLYGLTKKARYVSADELTLMGRMRAQVPADAKVIGDPGNGTPFIYAVSGVRVVFPHVFTDDSPAMLQIRRHLFDTHQLEANCQAIRDLNAFYFADFGIGSSYFAGRRYYPGLVVGDRSLMELVDSEGSARLYRITMCD